MISVDKALSEVKEVLGKGMYSTAIPQIRDILEQLEKRQSRKWIVGVAGLIWLCGLFIGWGLAEYWNEAAMLVAIGLFAGITIVLLVYLWTGAE